METFADYILNEKNIEAKIEIVYYLAQKEKIFFDKSVIFKTEIARLFLKYNKLDVDENIVLTACLLCNCKKVDDATKIEKVKIYAKEGANYLETLGFDERFCKICEEINRYNGNKEREKESDVLELVDQFGGMLLDRPERIGFEADEALVLLKHRNLKGEYNRYIKTFIEFIEVLEEINMGEFVEVKALKRLTKMFNESKDLIGFIKKVINNYEPQIDNLINNKYKEIKKEMFEEEKKNNRTLFSEETTRRIIKNIEETQQTISTTNK